MVIWWMAVCGPGKYQRIVTFDSTIRHLNKIFRQLADAKNLSAEFTLEKNVKAFLCRTFIFVGMGPIPKRF